MKLRMKRTYRERAGSILALSAVAVALILAAYPVEAAIPDADIREGVNQGGFGVISGIYGRADFSISERSAIGGYFGTDPNDIYFADFNNGDRRFDSDAVVGGHYMYQFVEGAESDERGPDVAGIFGAFANRGGMRPEVGVALSYPIDPRWTGRANVVYGPSWGFEMGYRFSPTVEGTIGVTGMGLVGLNLRF